MWGAAHDGARYLQVRVRLARQRSVYGPVLEAVRVDFTPLERAPACALQAAAPCDTCEEGRPPGLFRSHALVSGVWSDQRRRSEVLALAASAGDGLVVAGVSRTDSAASRDGFVLALDRFGRERWRWTQGRPRRDSLGALATTAGGLLVAGGRRVADDGEPYPWLLAFDADGGLAWERWPTDGAPGVVLALSSTTAGVRALATRRREDGRTEVVTLERDAGGEPVGEAVALPGDFDEVFSGQVAWLDNEDRLVTLAVRAEDGEDRRIVRLRTTAGGTELWRTTTDPFPGIQLRFAGELPNGDLLYGGWVQPGEPPSRECRLERLRGGGGLRYERVLTEENAAERCLDAALSGEHVVLAGDRDTGERLPHLIAVDLDGVVAWTAGVGEGVTEGELTRIRLLPGGGLVAAGTGSVDGVEGPLALRFDAAGSRACVDD